MAFVVYLIGSLILPIASFGQRAQDPSYFEEVVGNALPAAPWLNRAVVLGPLALALALAAAWHGRRVCRRLGWFDMPMAAWVLTPMLVGPFNDSRFHDDLMQTCYLGLVWGMPYLAGRLSLTSVAALHASMKAVVLSGALLLGLALLEFIHGRFIHVAVYGPHPFQLEGPVRLVGYRPLLAFEDPNQGGMWWATVALVGLGLLRAGWSARWGRAACALAMTPVFLFQAIGGALLTLFGATVLWIPGKRGATAVLLAILLLGGGLWLSRAAVLEYGKAFAESSPVGRQFKGFLRHSAIGSFGWRLAREEDHLGLLQQRPWFGWGEATFWRRNADRVRPWGLASLVAGAYGIVGLAAWASLTIGPCWLVLRRLPMLAADEVTVIKTLAVVLVVHAIDATLNSAYFLPAAFWMGGLGAALGPATSRTRPASAAGATARRPAAPSVFATSAGTPLCQQPRTPSKV